jgi:hypothetical protein
MPEVILICLDCGCIYYRRKKTATQETNIMYTSGRNFINIMLCNNVLMNIQIKHNRDESPNN